MTSGGGRREGKRPRRYWPWRLEWFRLRAWKRGVIRKVGFKA